MRTQELEAENELKTFLIINDKTEFAEENVEYLIKLIKNFDYLQMNQSITSNIKNVFDKQTEITDSYEESEVYEGNQFENHYDDYFS